MGPSGSGKSTLLHILGCLDQPSQGRYLLNGTDVAGYGDARLSAIRNRNIGFIFQAFHLLPQHTVLQNIAAPLLYTDLSQSDAGIGTVSFSNIRHRRAHRLAEQVGLGSRIHHRPYELSGGEMQRVAIARALITRPRVILADEPTGNLDSQTGADIMHILRTLHTQGHTIIVVTHEQAIADYAERIIVLKDGTIECEERRTSTSFNPQPPIPSSSGSTQPPPNDVEDFQRSRSSGSTQPHADDAGDFQRSRFLQTLLTLLPTTIMTAIHGILLHKLRSFLSVLGIVFGIGAIIAMLAIGAGARQEILDQIGLLGITNLTVRAVLPSEDVRQTGREQLSRGLTYDDVERIVQSVPYISALAAVRAFPSQLQYQQHTTQARIVGTESGYADAANLSLRIGRFLTPADEENGQRICILGADIQQALFAFQNPIGAMLKIRNDWFRVVGVLDNKALNPEKLPTIQMHDVNTDVYIPLATSAEFVPVNEVHQIDEIAIQVDAPERVDQVADILRNLLTRLHHGARDYSIVIPRELLQQTQQTQRVFNLVMGSIAGISLLVGGIGIMNIMLATITERTREIGIRRAIGANRRMILLQFLIETLLLTFVGGCLGVFLGIGGAVLISTFAGWRTIVSAQTVLLAFSISAIIGIIFGLYPASQGANMDPITALRYE
jgi:macrolide transport system ATP-binding/permease protein